ncbi:MAG: TonB-dependent receptor [Prevotella sp.]|jgi:TonB-linked SusC/RagA family outer membrane protein|nr:TonB-dependent receptor [Prevotella sp.]
MKDKKRQILIIVLLLMVSFLPTKGNIKAKPLLEHKSNLSVSSYPSQQTLKGIVQDQKGDPLIGVSVVVKGTSQGTVTDLNGNYSIEVTPGTTLVFSYIGFITKEIKIGNQTSLNISLKENAKNLDELVVIGYGSVRKRDLTGAVSAVGADKLKDRPYGNALQSMAGEVSGVVITQSQGAPGISPTIKVRGMSSINSGTSPLYVIDGIPMEDNTTSNGTNGGNVQYSNRNPLNNINPNDIESIEILKDASSAAIYGSRGANGVVIITTKSGKAGRTKISASYELGFSKVTRKIDLMDAKQWMEYETDARNNSYATALKSNPNLLRKSSLSKYYVPDEFSNKDWIDRIGNGTDWQDVLLRTGISHNIQVSASGGSEKTQFMISGSYLNQEGVVDQNNYKRYSVRSNINHQFNNHFSISMKLSATRSQDSPYGLSGKSDAVSLACQSDPIFPLRVETGSLGFKDPSSIWNTFVKYGFQLWHPYALTREMTKKRVTNTELINTYIDWKIIDGLTFRTALNASNEDMHYKSYWKAGQDWGYSGWVNATGSFQTLRQFNWAWENTLNYNKTFGDHAITGLLGYTMQKQTIEYSNMTGTGYPNDMVHTLNAATTISGSTNETAWSLISYLARVTYSYKSKYLASAAVRSDGCSRFGSNSRWGYFPSASLGWRASEEPWLKDKATWLDNLKFRLSYGQTGNNQIDNYGSIGLLGYSSYVINGATAQGLYTSTKPDPSLKWEKTWQVNFGIDAAIINNRLSTSLDLYYSRTNDLLLNVPTPVLTGFETSLTNIGSLRNQGIEWNLTSHNLVGEFKWTTEFNISANRNKVLKLGNGNSPIYVTTNNAISKTEVGQPIGNYFGYKILGVLSTSDVNTLSTKGNKGKGWAAPSGSEAGDPKVFDANGDGSITSDDRVILGNYQPNYTWGLTNTFTYKNFDLSFMLTGSQGGEIMNQNARFLGGFNGDRNAYASVYNYWRSDENPGDGMTPKPRTVNTGILGECSSSWVENGSFVRLKNLRLGYTFPEKVNKSLGLSNLRLYINLENVHVWSNYRNYDPENSTFQTGYLLGYDYGAYPTPFSASFGINVSF